MKKLSELARIIRSKNSGPFELTFDIMFPDEASFRRVKDSGVFTKELICRLYQITEEDIVAFLDFEPALAFKFTIKRSSKYQQGSVNEHDTFGTQQHVPLLNIEIP